MSYFRYRLTFGKGPELRFTGHLDLHRAWERTLRRAEIPLAYSEGHCEERSDEAIPNTQEEIASLRSQ